VRAEVVTVASHSAGFTNRARRGGGTFSCLRPGLDRLRVVVEDRLLFRLSQGLPDLEYVGQLPHVTNLTVNYVDQVCGNRFGPPVVRRLQGRNRVTPTAVLEVCPTVRTDPPRAYATRRSTDGFIILYLRHPSSYGCSYYRIEIVKYALCGGGGQKVRTRYVNAQKTLERHGRQ
jgi:hypothetical protein